MLNDSRDVIQTIIDRADHPRHLVELVVRECLRICENGGATQTTSSGAASLIRQYFKVQ